MRKNHYINQFKFGLVVLAIGGIIFFVNGCLKKRDFSQITYGMGKSAVIARLGEPDKIYEMPGGNVLIYDTAQISFIDTLVFDVSTAMPEAELLNMKVNLELKAKQYADSVEQETKRWNAHMDSLRSMIKN